MSANELNVHDSPAQLIRGLKADRSSMVARVRNLLPDIELAQQHGVSVQQIAVALAEAGFPAMTPKCLQNLLYQARRHRNKQRIKEAPGHRENPVMPEPRATSPGSALPALEKEAIDVDSLMRAAKMAVQTGKAQSTALALLKRPAK